MTKTNKTKLYRKFENKGWKEISRSIQNHVILVSDKILKTKRHNKHLYVRPIKGLKIPNWRQAEALWMSKVLASKCPVTLQRIAGFYSSLL